MSQLKEKYTQKFIQDNNLILGETLIGSYAFGLHTEKSDRDLYGVFYLKYEDFISLRYVMDDSYKNVVEKENKDDQDITYMEVGKFFQLLANGNPNALEILASLQESKNVVYIHELLKDIDITKVLSKKCHKSFGEYASAQISKARGLNKKIINPVEEERKTPLDFCSIFIDGKTKSLKEYLPKHGFDQKFCGVVALTNAKDTYAIYYDNVSDLLFSKNSESISEWVELVKEERRRRSLPMGYGFKGIEIENSNEIRLSSVPKDWNSYQPILMRDGNLIPKNITFIGYMSYNKDGYIRHCKDHLEYWNWVKNRNDERYNNNLKQNFDTKNISHCIRLLSVAKEIAEGKGIILQRTEDRQFLMDIKLGNVEYDVAMAYAENIANSLENLYKSSSLPEIPDFEYLDNKLIQIRKQLYHEQHNSVSN